MPCPLDTIQSIIILKAGIEKKLNSDQLVSSRDAVMLIGQTKISWTVSVNKNPVQGPIAFIFSFAPLQTSFKFGLRNFTITLT